MVFEGFLSLGGKEVVNSARAVGYTTTAEPPITWLQCTPCPGIVDVLGDDEYTYGNIADAPWYDAEDEATHRFLGVHALSIEGLPDSTRSAETSEAILDGGVVGRVRRGTRRMRVRAILSANGEDALETGFNWLSSALSPDSCGTHGDSCGAADMHFYTACPPEAAGFTKPEVLWNDPVTNLATNPSFETDVIPAGAERSTEWSMGGTYSLYIRPTVTTSGYGHGPYGHGPYGHGPAGTS